MQMALLAMLLALAQTPTVVPPRELLTKYPSPHALPPRAMEQCQRLPSQLACLEYQSNLYLLANPGQRLGLGQILAPQSSFLGRYRDAPSYDPFAQTKMPELGKTPPPPESDHAEDAVQAIAHLAGKHQLVMINEYHMDASTRVLTTALLPRLYAEGFRYLAVEALAESGETLERRGYAVEGTGYYTREPVFAELLSRAVRLGYTLVPYESSGATQRQREAGQARNIYRRIFKSHPDARVLVHAGIAHIGERPGMLPGNTQPMAMRLHALTGIDPLTVDQTSLRANTRSTLRKELLKRYRPTRPVVIEDAHGQPWSAYPRTYDVTVLMPDVERGSSRPAWLALYGSRDPVIVDAAWCKREFPCAILARPVARKDDAIPSDCYALLGKSSHTTLYLSPGRYRVEARDALGRLLSSRILTVPGEPQP